MGFAGEVGDHGGDLGQCGVDVAASDGRWGVVGEGLGDGVAAVAGDGGDGGVAEHVSGHGDPVGPGKRGAGPAEEGVVPAGRERGAVAGAEQPADPAAGAVVGFEQVEQRRGHGLFSLVVVLLAQPDG